MRLDGAVAPMCLLALAAMGCGDDGISMPTGPTGPTYRVMTFNIGTTEGLAHDKEDDPYTQELADIADALYENSLSYNPAEARLTAFLAEQDPDIAVFQEMYFDPWCEDITVDPALDFVCKDYTPDRPLQIQRILGDDYQVACAEGQDDNCIGVHRRFGSLVGCPSDGVCIGGLKGLDTPGSCGSGARVSGIVVQLADGGALTVVNMHLTSGIEEKDQSCRVAQMDQIFVDRGDGMPVASGARNLLMGDINTDPFLLANIDQSAMAWNTFVGEDKAFHYVSSDDMDGPGTYGGSARIDHIASDSLVARSCVVPGATEGVPPVLDHIYWDHRPVICDVAFD